MNYYKKFKINDDGNCFRCEGLDEGIETINWRVVKTFNCKIFDADLKSEKDRESGYRTIISCEKCKEFLSNKN